MIAGGCAISFPSHVVLTDYASNTGSDVDIYDVVGGNMIHWKATFSSTTPEPSLVGLSETYWVYAGGFACVSCLNIFVNTGVLSPYYVS